jgi:hypothetical protein
MEFFGRRRIHRPGLLFGAEEVPVYYYDFLHAAEGVLTGCRTCRHTLGPS